jgi:hypothetical protein
MKLKCCACLLILLVPALGLDDVWAVASNLCDDLQTADNDEFIHAASLRKRSEGGDTSTDRSELKQPVTSAPPAPSGSIFLGEISLSPVKPPLLYVLMSLQR